MGQLQSPAGNGSNYSKPTAEVSTVDESVATETTRLLGAGSVASSESNSSVPSTGDGAWNGLDDFRGLPWWRTPSVGFNPTREFIASL
jgi:hypothetical protein